MKRLISSIVLMGLLINPALSCDFKTIQKKGSEYAYSEVCHKEVGRIVRKTKELEKANLERMKQVEKLIKSIYNKDTALDIADQRIMNWRNESYKQHNRLLKQQKLSKYNDWAYFGSGIALTILSVWAAGQLRK